MKTIKGRAVSAALILTLAAAAAMIISGAILGEPTVTSGKYIALYILPLLTAAVVLATTTDLRPPRSTFATDGLAAGLKTGSYIPLAGLIFGGLFLIGSPAGTLHWPGAAGVALYVLGTLLTAVFEESIFRGAVLPRLLQAFAPWKAIVISAALFGATHGISLIGHPHAPLTAGTQMIYAFFLGALLGAVYLRTRSLLAPIILHFFFNLCGGLAFAFGPAIHTEADIPLAAAALQIALLAPAFFIARRSLARRGMARR